MKALLGSQCFALKGGPIYGVEQVLTTGNYAGVLVPTAMDNSLGIFTLTVPTTGLGSGTVALFRNGIFYPGTIQGIADPDSAILIGVVDSSFSNTFTSVTDQGTGTTEDFIIIQRQRLN